eukprot:Gb_36976 [translate_table: standard]
MDVNSENELGFRHHAIKAPKISNVIVAAAKETTATGPGLRMCLVPSEMGRGGGGGSFLEYLVLISVSPLFYCSLLGWLSFGLASRSLVVFRRHHCFFVILFCARLVLGWFLSFSCLSLLFTIEKVLEWSFEKGSSSYEVPIATTAGKLWILAEMDVEQDDTSEAKYSVWNSSCFLDKFKSGHDGGDHLCNSLVSNIIKKIVDLMVKSLIEKVNTNALAMTDHMLQWMSKVWTPLKVDAWKMEAKAWGIFSVLFLNQDYSQASGSQSQPHSRHLN